MTFLFLPGEIITQDASLISGHNTHLLSNYQSILLIENNGTNIISDQNRLYDTSVNFSESNKNKTIASSVYGTSFIQQKLLTCFPLYNLKYNPQIGDVIIGRIVSISDKRWIVDLNCCKQGILLLNSVDLQQANCHSANIQQEKTDVKRSLNQNARNSHFRRKINDDAVDMRMIYSINDLIVCEVNKIGFYVNIQTRSIISNRDSKNINKYNENNSIHSSSAYSVITENRKLLRGTVLTGNPELIVKNRAQIINTRGCCVILGLNGVVWVYSDNNKREVLLCVYVKKCFKENIKIEEENVLELINRNI